MSHTSNGSNATITAESERQTDLASALRHDGPRPRLLSGGPLWAPVSPGELLDKISILEIKEQRFFDAVKHANVLHELTVLREVGAGLSPSTELTALTADLKSVNESLWTVEDDLRDCESRHDFGAQFIALARAVYHHNDRRSAIKRQINELLGSKLIEEKVYVQY